jgi:hypothetical protein
MLLLATSTDVEHAFSCGGLTVSKMRHSLSDESTRAASVLGKWCDLPRAVPRDEIMAIFKDKGKRPKNNNVSAVSLEGSALGIGRGIGCPPMPLRDRPVAMRHQDLIWYALLHHPNTADGCRAYQAQGAAWHAANPHLKPDEQHPYPLTLGMPTVGSRKCWDCGQQDHRQRALICVGAILPEPERDWRQIAGFITTAFNKEHLAAAPQSVNLVNYTQYTLYPDYAQYIANLYEGEVEDSQGNGQGLSA